MRALTAAALTLVGAASANAQQVYIAEPAPAYVRRRQRGAR